MGSVTAVFFYIFMCMNKSKVKKDKIGPPISKDYFYAHIRLFLWNGMHTESALRV